MSCVSAATAFFDPTRANHGHPSSNHALLASLVRSLVARAQELGLREVYAALGSLSGALPALGFQPVAPGPVPDEVRFLRSYPKAPEADAPVLRLPLETRI
jgi:N-acetylglutamate synthase-like GNAT family acetyltransferase